MYRVWRAKDASGRRLALARGLFSLVFITRSRDFPVSAGWQYHDAVAIAGMAGSALRTPCADEMRARFATNARPSKPQDERGMRVGRTVKRESVSRATCP